MKLTNLNLSLLQPVKGIHIEPTNICTLKCAGCSRTQFIDQWPHQWKNHSLSVTQLMQFLDVDLSGIAVTLAGTYGDPIYHPEFHALVHELKQNGAWLTIITNGSHKKAAWWEELVSLLNSNDQIIFSVDGMPDNFQQYRVNADWTTIRQAMDIAVLAECKTLWKYIPFSFNEHNIEQAQQLSLSIGIDHFYIDPSDRFDGELAYLRPTLTGDRFELQQQWKQNKTINALDAKCVDGTQHYISADGHYVSCCYAADHRFYYKTEFGKNKKSYQITDQTLTEILTRPAVVEFYKDLTSKPVCQYNCPAT